MNNNLNFLLGYIEQLIVASVDFQVIGQTDNAVKVVIFTSLENLRTNYPVSEASMAVIDFSPKMVVLRFTLDIVKEDEVENEGDV